MRKTQQLRRLISEYWYISLNSCCVFCWCVTVNANIHGLLCCHHLTMLNFYFEIPKCVFIVTSAAM